MIKRGAYIAGGFVSVALGVIGIFVPLMPTTVFLLIAAWLFARSSPEARAWLLNHPILGKTIHNYLKHKGITRSARIQALCVLWITLIVSAWFTCKIWFVPLILLAVGIGVTIRLCLLKTVIAEDKP
jgi:uncharacterized membrane protein YbaN (DUF454 family)